MTGRGRDRINKTPDRDAKGVQSSVGDATFTHIRRAEGKSEIKAESSEYLHFLRESGLTAMHDVVGA